LTGERKHVFLLDFGEQGSPMAALMLLYRDKITTLAQKVQCVVQIN